jgi:hypothetical protein
MVLPLPSPLIYHARNHIFIHRRRRSHAIITPYGRRKKTVRINCLFAILQLSRSPFFQLNRCVWVKRAIGDISSHRPIFAPTLPPPARVYYKGAATQKEGEKRFSFDYFSVLLLTIFQLNCSRRPQPATWDISAHRRISTRRSRHSLASPYMKRRCKKNGEFLSRIDFLQ